MEPDHSDLLARIADLRRAAERGDRGLALVEAVEATLSEGYASALAGEAQLMRLEEDLEAMVDAAEPSTALDVGRVIREHRSVEHAVARLRAALAGMYNDFLMLGGARLR
jgi:hypothetical protein